ncbi:Pycsar system effector family protein [Erythrobacter sp.]|uniref:Pycsar system effector family protein n=1 Tax=Erythrobacter sp. TaxID=1042 RepID=UPI002EA4BFD5|nr:Pycsar system effector family protein [Erythrobacter sp.]
MAQAKPEIVSEPSGEIAPAASERKFSNHSIHLVRTAQTQTLSLSSMADNKASILIGATFVVFSMSITQLFGEGVTFSVLALAATAFISSLFAVMSVIPSVPNAPEDRANFNYLFFGHYTALSTEEWTEEMLDRFETDETLFRTMLKDIHQGGAVLAKKKYKYLNYAYRCFVWGVFVTWIVFAYERLTMF